MSNYETLRTAMNAQLSTSSLHPWMPRPIKPNEANQSRVIAEITRLVNTETFNERGEDRMVLNIALRIMCDRWPDNSAWDEALIDVFYVKTWSPTTFMGMVREGDECAIGKLIRDRLMTEFAEDCVTAALAEWSE